MRIGLSEMVDLISGEFEEAMEIKNHNVQLITLRMEKGFKRLVPCLLNQ